MRIDLDRRLSEDVTGVDAGIHDVNGRAGQFGLSFVHRPETTVYTTVTRSGARMYIDESRREGEDFPADDAGAGHDDRGRPALLQHCLHLVAVHGAHVHGRDATIGRAHVVPGQELRDARARARTDPEPVPRHEDELPQHDQPAQYAEAMAQQLARVRFLEDDTRDVELLGEVVDEQVGDLAPLGQNDDGLDC
jgi:hypothetical protein